LSSQREAGAKSSSQVSGALSNHGAVLPVGIGVTEAQRSSFSLKGQPSPPSILTNALIDTGAHVTCVDVGLLTRLGVKSHGSHAIHSVDGQQDVAQFLMSLRLSGKAGAIEDFVDVAMDAPREAHPWFKKLMAWYPFTLKRCT